MKKVSYTAIAIAGESISITLDGKTHTIPADASNFNDVMAAIRARAPDDVVRPLVNPVQHIQQEAAKVGFDLKVDTERDRVEVMFNGELVNSKLADLIVTHFRAGQDFTPLKNLLVKALANKVPGKVDILFDFLTNNALPVHPDGDFFAFKTTRSDGYDKHSGTVLYQIGKYVEPTTKPDLNEHHQCSSGLHIGGRRYVRNFGSSSDRYFIVKVNPQDVIYYLDHGDAGKMRVGKMFCYAETAGGAALDHALAFHVVMSPEGDLLQREAERRIAKAGAPQRKLAENEHVQELLEEGVKLDSSDVEASVAAEAEKAKVTPKQRVREAKKGQSFIAKGKSKAKHIFKTKDGGEFTGKEVLDGVAKHGQRGWSKVTGVARTTVQEWLKFLGQSK